MRTSRWSVVKWGLYALATAIGCEVGVHTRDVESGWGDDDRDGEDGEDGQCEWFKGTVCKLVKNPIGAVACSVVENFICSKTEPTTEQKQVACNANCTSAGSACYSALQDKLVQCNYGIWDVTTEQCFCKLSEHPPDPPPPQCPPEYTCDALGYECGYNFHCNPIVSCGTCPAGATSDAWNHCEYCDDPSPGPECGPWIDACGRSRDNGDPCAAKHGGSQAYFCEANQCRCNDTPFYVGCAYGEYDDCGVYHAPQACNEGDDCDTDTNSCFPATGTGGSGGGGGTCDECWSYGEDCCSDGDSYWCSFLGCC
jgi:hypothetical protein